MSEFNSIEQAISDVQSGKIIIMVDDEDRENEGDFVIAAEKVTPEAINFLAKNGRGLICVAMTTERLDQLHLHQMVALNKSLMGTAFTVSVDAHEGTSTGISAYDRALTIKKLIDPKATISDFARPGHVFPIQAAEGGVLRRAGHTEGIIDLTKLAHLYPAGVLCEIMDDDGKMARVPQLSKIASKFGISIITIRDLIEYRHKTEVLVHKVVKTRMPTKYGDFQLHLYESSIDDHHHLALTKGDISNGEPVLVRVHSQCLTGDIFGSKRCDCGEQLERALRLIEAEDRGILLYMRQEGRGIGLAHKIRAYELQDNGKDTVEANEALGFKADLRDYGVGAQILCDLGVNKIKLLTNNPKKIVGLKGYNLEIVERIPIEIEPNESNADYLVTKRDKLGHLILLNELASQDKKDSVLK